MDGKAITDLLAPVVGKPGQVRIVFQGLANRWVLNDEKHPLRGVRLRPDGLIETSRDDGWGVFDPDGVLAVEWMAGDGDGQGLYL